LELGQGAVDEDPTLVEDRDPVGEVFGLLQILGGEQHRGATLGELLDGLPYLEARLGVQPGRWLVQDDDRRIPDEAHREVEAAAHATRIGRHLPRGRLGQREPLEQVIGDRGRVLEVPQPGDQQEVLPPAEELVDGGELSGEADGLPHLGGLGGDVEAVDPGRPGVGLEQRGQDLHDRGLARPIGAEQGEDATGRHLEVRAAQHPQLLVRLLQTPHANRGPLDLIGCWRDAHDSQHGGLTPRHGQVRRADSIRPLKWKLRPDAPTMSPVVRRMPWPAVRSASCR
jgi:hypothetical protein